MALLTKNQDEPKPTPTTDTGGKAAQAARSIEKEAGALARGSARKTSGRAPEPGFFNIRKKGQGYWTRMGTIGAAALIGFLTAGFLYENLLVWVPPFYVHTAAGEEAHSRKALVFSVVAAFLVAYSLLVFWLTNKPQSVDFLIETDIEMKKVNWSSRKELIGSTKVVILFMFIIAAFLFLMDLFFGYTFYLCKVLLQPPL